MSEHNKQIGFNHVQVVFGSQVQQGELRLLRPSDPRFDASFAVDSTRSFDLSQYGLLPCGMTFVALGYCVTVDGPVDGFLSMIFFGLGTLPSMLGLSFITKPFIGKLPNIQTVLMIVSGILLIGRGLQHTEISHDIVVCGVHQEK